MKNFTVLCMFLVVGVSLCSAATYYSTSFESSQGFTAGQAIAGQGTPAWHGGFQWGLAAGDVSNADSFTGTQSLYQTGIQEGWVDMGQRQVAQWVEFAFKPEFGADPLAITRFMTLAGPLGQPSGVNMQLTAGTSAITCDGVNVGTFVNNAWQTISFANHISNFTWTDGGGITHNTVFTGYYDVYVNGVFKATVLATSGGMYNSVETLVFRAIDQTWTHNGTWFIDGVNVSDASIYVPEPATIGLLLVGGFSLIRRRRS